MEVRVLFLLLCSNNFRWFDCVPGKKVPGPFRGPAIFGKIGPSLVRLAPLALVPHKVEIKYAGSSIQLILIPVQEV
jgi:hypothetical protein